MTARSTIDAAKLRFDDDGLIPVVVQEAATGAVLMLAYADREAFRLTCETGEAHFWSRSRKKLWRKGETSGNVLEVLEVTTDCDADSLLVRAIPRGPTCHRGTRSCFEPNAASLELGWLRQILDGRRAADPGESYTAALLAAGIPRMAQKVGEEAVETALAAVATDGRALTSEAADLLYHLSVLLMARGIEPREVALELLRRHRGNTREEAGTEPHSEEDR